MAPKDPTDKAVVEGSTTGLRRAPSSSGSQSLLKRLSAAAATSKSPTGSISRSSGDGDTQSQASKSSGRSRRSSLPASLDNGAVLDRLKRAATAANDSKQNVKASTFSRNTLDHSTNLGTTRPIFEENEDQLFSNASPVDNNNNQFLDSAPKSAPAYQALIWEAHAKNLEERLRQARQNKRKAIHHFTNIEKNVYKVQLEDLTHRLRESIKYMQTA